MNKASYLSCIEQAESLELNAIELADDGHPMMARILKDKANMLRNEARAMKIAEGFHHE